MATTSKLVELFNALADASLTEATATAFVEAAYENLLGLSGDFSNKDARVAYWVAQIEGGVSRADFASTFLAAAAVQGDLLTDAEFAANGVVLTALEALDETDLTLESVKAAAVAAAEEAAEEEEEEANAGETFTLTTSTDSFVGTAKNDTFNAASGTLATADTILDSSSDDADVLNVEVIANDIAARVQNVETINVNGTYATTGMDLANTSGAETLNLSAEILGATATVTNASSLNAENIVSGENVSTLSVTATASGTRDTVNVDTGVATSVTVAGGAGADNFALNLKDGASATLDGDASIDSYSVDISGVTASLAGHDTNTETLTINATGDASVLTMSAMTADYATATKYGTTVTGDADLTIKAATATADSKGLTNSGTGTVTVRITDATAAADFSNLAANVLELTTASGGAATVLVNANTTVNLDEDINGGVLTLNGASVTTANQGTVLLNVSDSQTAAVTAGDEIGTVIITATPDEVADTASGAVITLAELDTDSNNTGTSTVVVNGSSALKITTLTNNSGDVVSATNMSGALTIATVAAASTMNLGSGNDVIGGTAVTGAQTLNGNGGNDTLNGGAGDDVIDGGEGDDTINGGAGANTLKGGAGKDTITGGAGVDTITAGEGDDTVNGAAGNDVISLGAGADTLLLASGEGTDVVSDFVLGEDKLILTGAAAGNVNVSSVSPVSGTYTLDTNFVVTLTGNTATDLSGSVQLGKSGSALTSAVDAATIVGGDFADVITSTVTTGQSTTIKGGAGNDVITASSGGAATITGGAGMDIITLGTTDAAVVVYADGDSGITADTADIVVGFTTTSDTIKTGTAGTAGNYTEISDADLGASTSAGLAAALTAASDNSVFNGTIMYAAYGNSNSLSTEVYLLWDADLDGTVDNAIVLDALGVAGIAFGDITA